MQLFTSFSDICLAKLFPPRTAAVVHKACPLKPETYQILFIIKFKEKLSHKPEILRVMTNILHRNTMTAIELEIVDSKLG